MDVFFICEQYLAAKSKKCRQNTLDGYVSAIRCHVLPKWGGRELAGIRRKEVQDSGQQAEQPRIRLRVGRQCDHFNEQRDKHHSDHGAQLAFLVPTRRYGR